VTGSRVRRRLVATAEDTWPAIQAGTSGVRTLEQDWVAEHELPVTFAASVHTPPDQVLPKVEVRRNDPAGQYALIASREAWAQAGTPEIEPERLGVAIGSGIGGVWTLLD